MPPVDLASVLGLGVFVAALMTVLCASVARSLGVARSARLLMASGATFTLALATRLVAGDHPAWWSLAVTWSLAVVCAALCHAAVVELAGLRSREDGPPWGALAMLIATLWFAMWTMPTPHLGAFVSAVGNLLCSLMSIDAARRIEGTHLAPARRTLVLAFGVFAVVSLNAVIGRLAEMGFGVRLLPLEATAFLAVVTCCLVAIGFVQLTYLQTHASARALANFDALTGALNRRGFAEGHVRLRERSPAGCSGALVLIDIDLFKRINDTHGHAVGDEALRGFVEALRRFLRADDLLVRLGGEEFCILLPGTSEHDAAEIAERIRVGLEQQSVAQTPAGPLCLTASFGVAPFEADDRCLDARLRQADEALYGAKRAGRNRVERWSGMSTGFLPV
jgi:diguanylate cyclase (GGDEF)-like protein